MVEAGAVAAPQSASIVGPVFVLRYTPGVIAGLILAALLAAIMSTSDSFLNIGAAAASRDIPRALGRPIESDRTELRVTQGALAGLTVLSVLVVFYSDALVGILGTPPRSSRSPPSALTGPARRARARSRRRSAAWA
jgi:sodium/proline symporter/sodium/pantothenate symporter